jgi:hypothetical protein
MIMIDAKQPVGPPADATCMFLSRQDCPELLQRQPIAAGTLLVAIVGIRRPLAAPTRIVLLFAAGAVAAPARGSQVLIERVVSQLLAPTT